MYFQILTSLNHYQSLPRHLVKDHLQGGGGSSRLLPTLPATLYSQEPPSALFATQPPPHQAPSSRAVSYFSTLDPRAMTTLVSAVPPGPHRHFAELSAAETITPPPKQFDSYYYHPSTLRVQPHSIGHQPPPVIANGGPPVANGTSGGHGLLKDLVVPDQSRGEFELVNGAVSDDQQRLVYADMGQRQEDRNYGGGGRRQGRQTEYDILKFNNNKGLSSEIDV